MAQPPLSMQLKHLEEKLNVQLIIRTYHGNELTEKGKLLYKRALQILSFRDFTKQDMASFDVPILRCKMTSSNHSLLNYLDNELIFNDKLSFRIYERSTYTMLGLLLTHNIDMAFVRTPFDQSQVKSIHLCEEPMNHMMNYKHVPLIIHQRYLSFIADYCLQYNFQPFIKFTCDDSRTSLLYAKYGYGVVIVPKRATDMIDYHIHIEELQDEQLYTSIVIIYRKGEQLDTHLKQIISAYLNIFTL